MLKNHLRSAFRHIMKNRSFVLINILGLSIGMAVCLLIMQYVSYENSYDRFHDDFENIYRVQFNVYKNGELKVECAAAVPAVGPAMKENFPEVLEFCRAFPIDGIVSYQEKSFRERKMQVADPSFIDMLTFPLVSGDPLTALKGANKCILTQEAALRFFDDEEPIGKSVTAFNKDFEITGILADVPANSHIKFSFIFSFQTLVEWYGENAETAWGWYDYNTYVKLQPGTDHQVFNKKFDLWLQETKGESWAKYNSRYEFPLQPLQSIHLYSDLLQESEPEENGNADSVKFLTIIALFILVIAWVNYINMATARAVERSREVGIRKIVGASRTQLINQFLLESIILNIGSLVIAFVLVELFLPLFRNLTGVQLALNLLKNLNIWLYLSGLFVCGTIISGLYPAFLLSSFPPLAILKGTIAGKSRDSFIRSLLVILQFIISFSLIAGIILVYQQLAYMRSRDIGFELNDTFVLKGPGVYESDSLLSIQINAFKDEISKYHFLKSFTTSTNIPGDEIFWGNGSRSTEQTDDKFLVMYIVGIDESFIPAFDLKLIAGRNFSREIASDDSAVVINRSAIDRYEFLSAENAIGKEIFLGNRRLTVVGVIEDFNQMSLKTGITPLAFPYYDYLDSYFSFKFNSADIADHIPDIKKEWQNFFPGNPFDYFFLDEFYDRQYKKDIQFSKVFGIFTFIAIFIALLGLLALSVFDNIRRNKEIGIRKANGASTSDIVLLLVKNLLKKIILAIIIAIPVTWFIMQKWLASYAYHIKISPFIFIISALITLAVALAALLIHSITTAQRNPSEILKYE
ncbi:MAG: ABC transporter permease [Candidatus Cloacimonetes bacterium]|nr:ABC transporter permease [Candidatus Cloacimonadota bacterium]